MAKPETAVTLAPYKHQVGGHSTIFRFSRRAVCKQLNNRENEFYDRVEQSHPDMLKFMPRYIGVLNVTFSKGPKQSSDDTANTESPKRGTPLSKAPEPNLTNGYSDNNQVHHAQPRIVSHSQQLDSIPQVLLDQNRHLLHSKFFGLPQRPKSADPSHFRQRNFSHNSTDTDANMPQHQTNGSHHPVRPSPLAHTDSYQWGISAINDNLKAKVLREVLEECLFLWNNLARRV